MLQRLKFAVLLTGFAAMLQACGLPTSGPRGEQIGIAAEVAVESNHKRRLPYCLVPVTPEVVSVVYKHQPRLAGNLMDNDRRRYSIKIGIGDVVSVTIFEAAAGGLFFPLDAGLRQGNFVVLPNQIVDDTGSISVPYAGAIRAAGLTVRAVQEEIVSRLSSRALEPQAVVTVVDQRTALINVIGDVSRPVRYAASAAPERVLDAVARAGGPRNQGYETWVLVERQGNISVAPFEALVHEPANNVVVHPGDTIYLFREPQTFLAFGATGRQGQFPFEQWRLNLGEAIGRAGGLVDIQAEPSWVFVYRAEKRHVVEQMSHKCAHVLGDTEYVPVIYEVDLREPSGYFLASKFPVRNKDVVYVANARAVEATKFMEYLRTINSTINDPMQTAITAYTLKNLIKGGASSAATIITTGATN